MLTVRVRHQSTPVYALQLPTEKPRHDGGAYLSVCCRPIPGFRLSSTTAFAIIPPLCRSLPQVCLNRDGSGAQPLFVPVMP